MLGFGKLFFLLVMLSCCIRSQAGVGFTAPIDLHHTSWSVRDGAPALILSMTQTKDGWLWLGGPSGLYRFDGLRFEQFAPSNGSLLTRNISVVNAFADGALWIGYRTGGAAQLVNGRIRNFSEREGLPGRAVWGVERDGDGRIWAATAQGLYLLDNGHWEAAADAWKAPRGWYKTLMRDRQGVLWAQGDMGVYLLRPGKTQFDKAPVESGTGVLFELPDGHVVSWDAARAHFNQLTAAPESGMPKYWEHLGDPTSLLFDRRGNLWVGLKERLEYHTEYGISLSAPPQGLSGPSVGAIFEDREGNVWTATAAGIDRFRTRRLARIDVPQAAIGAAIMADDTGGAWIGGFHVSNDQGDARVKPLWPENREGWADFVTSYTRAVDGTLWSSSYGALRRIKGKDFRKVELPAAIGKKLVSSLLIEPDGDLLVALQGDGLYRRKASGEWEKAGIEDEVSVMARSEASGLWLASFSGSVLHAERGVWRIYGQADGLALGLVMALHLHGGHVWAGGDSGLALFDEGRFKQVYGANGETFDGISGMVELDSGDLWLNATAGLFRISSGEIARFKRTSGYRVQYERLDQLDGLEGSAPRLTPSPSLVLASDSRLWIVRSTGVFRLDPAEQLPPSPAQPVIIKTVGPPGERNTVQARTQFAPGVKALQIDYTIPSLAMPERVRFRYRLDEVDTDWQEVGARRSAYYSNLAAGDYHFHVAASDYSGKWADQQTTLHFSIAPAMVETWWFKALCGVLLLSAAYLAYRWQVNRVARQVAHRLQVRVSERERIARELHDTLLQSVQGLMLHIQAAVMKLPARDSMRLQLESALELADEVLDEGRGRILALRGEEDQLNFPDAILAAARRLQNVEANGIRLKIGGTPRQLDSAIYQDAIAIITEAIANAYNHARATRIEVELHYGASEFRCIVRDDGCGIPAEILSVGGRENHWGMLGMAERAARMSARLALRSDAGAGTEWQLSLAAASAYTQSGDERSAL